MSVDRSIAPFLAFLALAGPSCPPRSVDRVAQCAALYDNCVETSSSRAAYLQCREAVDVQCLDTVTEERP
jgi:hypothetical protein